MQLKDTFDYPDANDDWRTVVDDKYALEHTWDDGLSVQALAFGLVPLLYEQLVLIIQVVDDFGLNDGNLQLFGYLLDFLVNLDVESQNNAVFWVTFLSLKRDLLDSLLGYWTNFDHTYIDWFTLDFSVIGA